jgi:WD40 repeat protein
MVRTKDNLHTLIESLANPAHPATLCTLSANASSPKFVTLTDIGYAISNATPETPGTLAEIQRMSLSDGQPVTVATLNGDATDVAWSPDGSNVAYIASSTAPDGANADQLWLKVGGAAPQAMTPPIEYGGRDGSLSDQTIVSFSPDGKYLLMVDTFVAGAAPSASNQAVIQVYSVADGKLVWVPPSALGPSLANKIDPSITMAAWAHLNDRLYYRDQAGVHTWDPAATVGTLARGLAWYSPSVSSDGRYVAYAVLVSGKPHIEVRDLVAGAVRVLPGILGDPILLSDQEMIESHFARNTQLGPPYTPTANFVLHLVTRTETALAATPIDTWPR